MQLNSFRGSSLRQHGEGFMSKFPITLDNVHAAIREKGHSWHAVQTSMAQLEHEDALKRLGFMPGSDEPSLDERERRSARNAAPVSASGSASAAGTATSTDAPATSTDAPATSTDAPAASTDAPAAVAAPGTTAAGAPAAGAGPGVVDWRKLSG